MDDPKLVSGGERVGQRPAAKEGDEEYGDEDTGIPVEQVEDLRAAAGHSAVEFERNRYPDAPHGFNCDERGSYHEPSARLAWQRSLDWFDRHLAG